MAPYKENFPIGAWVRIASRSQLQEFQAAWRYHHALTCEQLAYGDTKVVVERVSFYHGGDVLYELTGVPGIWHECCLFAVDALGISPGD